MGNRVDIEAVVGSFHELQREFPHLKMTLNDADPNVDLNMDIPRQDGLAFSVNLNLQGEELHLTAGAFWLEWFPCSQVHVIAAYRDAVRGLLSGEYRIVEHRRAQHAVSAELQCPVGAEWRTMGTWRTLDWRWWLPKNHRILRNVP